MAIVIEDQSIDSNQYLQIWALLMLFSLSHFRAASEIDYEEETNKGNSGMSLS